LLRAVKAEIETLKRLKNELSRKYRIYFESNFAGLKRVSLKKD
jgi:hypothetical protein